MPFGGWWSTLGQLTDKTTDADWPVSAYSSSIMSGVQNKQNILEGFVDAPQSTWTPIGTSPWTTGSVNYAEPSLGVGVEAEYVCSSDWYFNKDLGTCKSCAEKSKLGECASAMKYLQGCSFVPAFS